MWLVVLAFSAAISTAIWYSKAEDDKYLLKFLSLLFWGATVMVFVDHVMGYLMEGGEFLEATTEATVLGIVLVITALIVWEAALLIKDPRGVIYRKRTGKA